MNGCSREKIREVLRRNGISEAELPGKPGRKPTAEETEIFKPAKKSSAKPDDFRSGKPESVAEKVEEPEEILPMEEEPVKDTPEPNGCVVPETVKSLCRDRILGIIQEVAELEREKRELQEFLVELEREKRELQGFLGESA